MGAWGALFFFAEQFINRIAHEMGPARALSGLRTVDDAGLQQAATWNLDAETFNDLCNRAEEAGDARILEQLRCIVCLADLVAALAAAELLWRSMRLHRAKRAHRRMLSASRVSGKADRNFCDALKAIDTSKLFVDTPDEFKEIASWCNAEAHKQVQRETADMLKAYSNMWEEALRSTNAIATICCPEWQPAMLSLLSKPDIV